MALEGTLQDMSLSDLFQVFRLGPKSGILVINCEQQRGVIYVNKGTLVDAFVVAGADRKVIQTGEEAVLHMLTWDDADFVFRHDLSADGRPVQIKHDSEWLVLEGLRRRSDPQQATPYQSIGMDSLLQLSPLPASQNSGVNLDVDQWRILSYAANNQNIRSICEETGIEPTRALRIAAQLLAVGLVEVVNPKPAASARDSRPPHAAQTFDRPIAQPAATPRQESDAETPAVGRGLLNAIMRRISEL